MPQRVTNRLIGDLGIALTGHDIHRCLAADKLRQRRHHDGKAILGPHLHCLLHRRRQAVFGTDFAQLITQIENHAAGNLMDVLRVVIGHRLADGKALATCAPSATSACNTPQVTPSASTACCVAFVAAGSRTNSTGAMPRCAKAMAVAEPTPRAAPVTRATRF